MSIDLREIFTPAAVAAYYTDAYSNSIPYLGRGLFPARKKAGLKLSWIKGSRGVAVSLMPSAFDAKATFRDRIGFKELETEMPFFREGYHLGEIDRQAIMDAENSNNPYVKDLIARVYDDVADLIAGADVVPERMIFQLLFPDDDNGPGISIKANGMDYTYQYDTDDTWKTENVVKLKTTSLWSAADTADPFKDFDNIKSKALDKSGAAITRAIMNSTTYNMMAKMKSVQGRFLTMNGAAVGYVRPSDVSAVITDATGINLIVYDKKYRNEEKKTEKFVPDGYVALIPDGPLGETYYGTTPEEADLRNGNEAEVSIVNTGVAITRIVNPHPVNVDTFASEIVLPTFTAIDDCYLLKVVGE